MFEALKDRVLLWSTTAAATLTGLQFFTPTLMDWMLDWMVVGLVFIAAKVAQSKS